MREEDTIVAISTALNQAGIGIVRLSGGQALEIAETICRTASGQSLSSAGSHVIMYGYIINPDSREEIDEALITIMRKPRSYTREDIVEINCHSGIVPLKKTVSAAIRQGARLAEPGEFTKRAFLNGRIDLAQAEAVIDLIKAETKNSCDLALKQLKGDLSRKTESMKEGLLEVLVNLEAAVDFPEEDIEPLERKQLIKNLSTIIVCIEQMLEGAEKGMIYREGLKTAITGKPNVGKSSLLNMLLRKERAIVTPIPGTTRDIIEEGLNVQGIPLRIVDTAGIREPDDLVEEAGVGLTRKTIEEADLVLCVFDQSQNLESEDMELLSITKEKKSILVLNKSDLSTKLREGEVKKLSGTRPIVRTCALTGAGLEQLEGAIQKLVFDGGAKGTEDILVSNIRHVTALEKAVGFAREAEATLREEESEEIIAMAVRESLTELGRITGETTSEDLLDRIFSEFCIGK